MPDLNPAAAGLPQLPQQQDSLGFLQSQAAQQAQNQLMQAKTGGELQEQQAKLRAMQQSMAQGIINADPEKQEQVRANLIPIMNKLNPSLQFDPNIDISSLKAFVQGGVSPEKQAELANQMAIAKIYGGYKAMDITKDPVTGQLIRVNKATGERSLLTPAESASYGATGQIMPDGSADDSAAQQPAFGFNTSNYGNDIPALNIARKNAGDFEKIKQQRDMLANQTLAQIEALRPDLSSVHGGSMLNQGELAASGVFGTGEAPAAKNAASLTQGLALNLSNLQQVGGSGRAMKAALQTLLNSKPDPYGNYNENNISNLNHIESTVNQYKLETQFLDAYKDANPVHIIDNKAYDLFDALNKQFPLESVDKKTGKVVFNAQNAQAIQDAIPDALANPYKYMGKGSSSGGAAAQVQSGLKTAAQTPIVTTQAAFDALPSGAKYVEVGQDGKPQTYRKP